MVFTRNSGYFGLPIVIAFIFVSAISSAQYSEFGGNRASNDDDELLNAAESGRTVRVMVTKEFKLQPDGSYKEIYTQKNQKKVVSQVVNDQDEYETDGGAESAPKIVYAYNPYGQSNYYRYNYNKQHQNDQQSQGSHNQYVVNTYNEQQQQPYYYISPPTNFQEAGADAASPSNSFDAYFSQIPSQNYYQSEDDGSTNKNRNSRNVSRSSTTVSSLQGYPQFEINKASSQSFVLDGNGIRSANPDTGYRTISTQASVVSYNQQNPASIQEIIKNPAESQNSEYYSPKDQSYYDTTGAGPSSDYGSPAAGIPNSFTPQAGYDNPSNSYGNPTGSYVAPSGGFENPSIGNAYGTPTGGGYEQPPVSSYGSPAPVTGYGWTGDQGGGVINTIVNTVAGVGKTKAAQVSQVIKQKGEIGNQIIHSKGQVVNNVVHQGAQKAQLIGHTLAQVPARFSQVLRTKADIASGILSQKAKVIGTVVHVKTQAANQASALISAKGKAASAVIKASGGTAADLIIAKGKGIANLITSGGHAATALLGHKGNKVQAIAQVISGVGGGWSGSTGSNNLGGGFGGSGGYEGGYSENVPSTDYRNSYGEAPARVPTVPTSTEYTSSYGQAYENNNSPSADYGYDNSQQNNNNNNYNSYGQKTKQKSANDISSNDYGSSSYGHKSPRAYEELQSALKTVVDSPTSSHEEGQTKLSSAFKSIYDNFKAGQHQPSFFPVGSFSTPVQVTVAPTTPSPTAAIGQGLTKMSKMLTNVASVIDWFSPAKKEHSSIF